MDTTGQEYSRCDNVEWRFLKTEDGFMALQFRRNGATYGDGKEVWTSVRVVDAKDVKPWREG